MNETADYHGEGNSMSEVLIAALALVIGYEKAAHVFQQARREKKSIRRIVSEDHFLSTEQLDDILNLPALAAG
jgi:fumarate hydratase class II